MWFYYGCVIGYCEKLILQACDACMLRPDKKFRPCAEQAIHKAVDIYPIEYTEIASEYWITRTGECRSLMRRWRKHPTFSPEWHTERARIVGIPEHLIDTTYHLRRKGDYEEIAKKRVKSVTATPFAPTLYKDATGECTGLA